MEMPSPKIMFETEKLDSIIPGACSTNSFIFKNNNSKFPKREHLKLKKQPAIFHYLCREWGEITKTVSPLASFRTSLPTFEAELLPVQISQVFVVSLANCLSTKNSNGFKAGCYVRKSFLLLL